MTWVKVDDCAVLHPKLLSVPLQAVGLWLAGLCHANRHGTDGRILKSAMGSLHPSDKTPRWLATKTAKLLVEAGLWQEANDAFLIVNYEVYQREALADRQREKREQSAERQRAKRVRDRQPSDDVATAKRLRSDCEPQADLSDNESLGQMSRAPVPARPDPDLATLDQTALATLEQSGVFRLTPEAPPPRAPKPKPKRDAERALLRQVLSEQAQARGLVTPTLGQRPLAEALARAHEFAALKSQPFEAALRTMVSEAYDLVQTGRSSAMVWALRDWQPGVPIAAPRRGLKSTRAPCTTGKDFPTEEEAERRLEVLFG